MTVGFMVGRQLATVLLTAIASRSLPSRQGVRSRLQSRRPCWSATMQTIGGRRGAADRDEAADE
jgi:hypothetical protein